MPERIADQVAEMLRQGGDISEIRKKFRSASQVAEGVRIFLDEIGSQINEERNALQALKKELSETRTKLAECKATVETLSKETGALRTEKQELTLDVSGLTEKKNRLQNEIADLKQQGYTPGLLTKIRSVEPRSGPQLWSDLKLASQCHQRKAENQVLRQEKTTLESEIKELKEKKEEETKLVRSEENRLDDLRLQAEAVKEAVSTVEMFFKDGWSTEDLKCLKEGLKLLGMTNEPRASISRLLRALGEEKSLASLSEKVEKKREELTMLNTACAKVKADSQVIQTVTVKTIEETRDASVKAIDTVAEHGKTAIEADSSSLEKLAAETATQIKAQVQQTIKTLNQELERWAALQQENAKLEQLIIPARALFGIIENPDSLNSIPASIVVQLFERLQAWCQANLKHFMIQPPANISERALNLHSFEYYDLAILTELVCEGLKQYMIQKNKSAQTSPGPGNSR